MSTNIGHAITAICTAVVLTVPAGVSAQALSTEADGLASFDSPGASAAAAERAGAAEHS
jgi:hypothetical protein